MNILHACIHLLAICLTMCICLTAEISTVEYYQANRASRLNHDLSFSPTAKACSHTNVTIVAVSSSRIVDIAVEEGKNCEVPIQGKGRDREIEETL